MDQTRHTTQFPTPYAYEPLIIEKGLPVFSERDAYSENYDKIADEHLTHMSSGGGNPFIPEGLWNEMEESTVLLLRKYTKDGDRVLDAGVGLGRLLSRVPNLDRYGVDISLGYLERAREQGIQVCLAKLEDLPYKAEFFDAVVATDVLEHVLDLNLCVRKLLKVLKPGGVVIIRVPYKEDLSPYTHPDFPYEFVHVRNFNEHSLTLLFTKIFPSEVLEWTTTCHWPGPSRLKYGHRAPMRFVFGALSYFLRQSEFLRSSWLSRSLFLPAEINFAIRKRT